MKFKNTTMNLAALAAGMLLLCGSSLAAEYKIGFVNPARLLQESPQATAATQALEKEFAPRQRDLEAKQKELKTMQDRLNKDGAVMSESERGKLERNLYEQQRDFQRKRDELQEDLTYRRNDELGKIQRQFVEVIQLIAKEQKFDLIVSEGVIYSSEQMDITAAVLDQLKKNSAPK